MLSNDLKSALGVALNEASLLGLEFDPDRRLAGATFSVLSLPSSDGPMPADPRVQVLLSDVCRVAASLRGGRWDDAAAPVLPLSVSDLLAVVQSFGGLPVYGWEFFDTGEKELAQWGDRLSLDWKVDESVHCPHSLALFQDGMTRHLDVCLWFEEIEVRAPTGALIPLEDFAAAGKRWWDAFHSHDPRTQGLGLAPLSGEPSPSGSSVQPPNER